MLTQETKRKIDSARQILVGKVPDPKAQVEQITTALIYKFMDDMDKEAQELGGKARFFTNGYQKYAWTKLMDAKLGGHERLDLYLEAITSLSRNPHIPQLFRDIFKDAFLPYRSPETLSMFLKEINGFTYEHSEDLGDAFEYLLSILGSQGDAGQFRTPRHIIDFIVAAVAPNKGETICDPACGTAGFLISAFKHILKENREKSLTPDERKNLMDHFVGYDISPDMVRLSKVNLYLHGFPSPTIFEYDTLSSEEKWDENFDVMLANPPFMSPSGGIRPHKRFSVQANRAEVLFVDYILEHLRPNGRAGIIVPEGIIFQSATAYKALRKLLIEDGLLAVVSLPAGVFNPYAGVKTSILLFDNGLAKKTKEILFLKIQNDGYGLGAQRREIDKNDLPLALEIIKKYKSILSECHSAPDAKSIKKELDSRFRGNDKWREIAHLVAKDKIAESGLPAPRPTTYVIRCNDDSFYIGQTENLLKRWQEHKKGLADWTKKHKPIEVIHYEEFNTIDEAIKREKELKTGFGRRWLKREHGVGRLKKWNEGSARQAGDYNLSGDRYKEAVNFANQKWPMVEVGKVADIGSGNSAPQDKELFKNGKYPFFRTSDVGAVHISDNLFDSRDKLNEAGTKGLKLFPKNTILFPKSGASTFLNHRVMLGIDGYVSSHLATITPNENKILPKFLFNLLKKIDAKTLTNDQNYPSLKTSEIAKIKIPFPPIEVQKEIIEQIEVKQKAIDAAKAVIENLERERRYFGQSLRKINYEWVDLVSICKKITDGTHKTPKYTNTGIPFLRVTDITGSNETKKFISKEEHKELIKRCKPERGDVLYSKNGTIGVAKVVNWDWEFSIFVSLALLKPNREIINSDYLAFVLNTDSALSQAKAHSKAGTVTNLHLIEIKQIKIPLPSLEIQKQLVAEMEEQEKIIEANKKLVGIMEQKISAVLSEV